MDARTDRSGAAPVVSIELLLDAGAESAVRAEWQALASAGLSSMAAHTSANNRPHLTLLVRTVLDPFDASTLVPRLGFAITLGAPLLFGSGERRVLARSIVPSAALLDLHAAVHVVAGPGDDAAHTAPGEWTPHVTLARRLKTTDAAHALSLVGEPIDGVATGLRRWDAATKTVTDLGSRI